MHHLITLKPKDIRNRQKICGEIIKNNAYRFLRIGLKSIFNEINTKYSKKRK